MKLPLEGDIAIEFTQHAMIVRPTTIPMEAWDGLVVTAKGLGYDQMDFCMPQVLGAVLVFSTKDGIKAMREKHEASLAHLPPLERWLLNWDKGISSMTMVAAILPSDATVPPCCWQYKEAKADIPHDADDFGRCVRLLDALPEFRPKIQSVADLHPSWQPIIDHWDELEALYRDEQWAELTERFSALR